MKKFPIVLALLMSIALLAACSGTQYADRKPDDKPRVFDLDSEEFEEYLDIYDEYLDFCGLYITNYQFDLLKEVTDRHIKEQRPPVADISYQIRDALAESNAAEIYKKCIRLPLDPEELCDPDYDESLYQNWEPDMNESDDFIYIKNRSSLSSNINLVAAVGVLDNEMVVLVGGAKDEDADFELTDVTVGGKPVNEDLLYDYYEYDEDFGGLFASVLRFYTMSLNEAGKDAFAELILSGELSFIYRDYYGEYENRTISLSEADKTAFRDIYTLFQTQVALEIIRDTAWDAYY
ncbi:MAG: hypothetical protein FWG31_07535 [Oscillospiraceae bacterium]|nr:hypothetical protein [Oscillospiraceae bacterium]